MLSVSIGFYNKGQGVFYYTSTSYLASNLLSINEHKDNYFTKRIKWEMRSRHEDSPMNC